MPRGGTTAAVQFRQLAFDWAIIIRPRPAHVVCVFASWRLLMPLGQKVLVFLYNVMLRNKCTMNELNSIHSSTVLQKKSRNNGNRSQWWFMKDIRSISCQWIIKIAQKLLECVREDSIVCKKWRAFNYSKELYVVRIVAYQAYQDQDYQDQWMD